MEVEKEVVAQENLTPPVEEEQAAAATPSIEELMETLKARENENLQLKQAITRKANDLNALKGQASINEQLLAKLRDQEDNTAVILDYLAELKGEPIEEEVVKPKSHRDALKERREREAAVSQPKGKDVDIEESSAALAAITLLQSRGWGEDSPVYQKTMGITSAKEALKVIQQSIKEADEERITSEIQKKQKELGLTASPVVAPSGADMTSEQFLEKFGQGEIPYNKANVEKAKKLLS